MGKNLHVLIVEDSEDDHELVVHALRNGGFDVTAARVATADTLRSTFQSRKWDAVISDYVMPGFDGLAALELIKDSGADLPFIVVSGREDIAAKMIKAGAHDYLNKRDLSGLAPTVERELGEAEQRRLRKLAEAKLRETRQQLNQALDASGLGAFHWDMITDETWRSFRYDQIFGEINPASKLDFDTFLNRVLPEDREQVRESADQAVTKGDFDTECRIIRTDGSVAFISTRGKLFYDEAGKPTRMIGTVADITERKLTERKSREQEELIRLLLDSTAEAIFGVNLDGVCTWANPACARMLGYAGPEELKGQHIHSLIHHHRADGTIYPEEECHVNEAYRTGQGTHMTDEVFWRADGTKFEIEYFSYPIRRGSEVIGAVVTFLDISDRKQLEEQLRHAQKMEAIGQLAGGVAHDFNNVLAVILMQAELMESSEELSSEQRQFIGEISRAAERAANLTRQLLMFSRRQKVQMRELELNEVVRSLTQMLMRILGENIEIQFKWWDEPLFIKADAGMIDQIVMNLVVNARDAMPDGGKLVIETSATNLDEQMAEEIPYARAGSFVRLCVTDNGCGIPPENLRVIFEPFFTTKEVGKGTGIGLATVVGIVQQHDGWINVESEVGRGTSFHIYLPSLPGAPTPATVDPLPVAAAAGHETILLVEDDPDVSNSVQSILSQLGYHVLSASTGGEALEIWREHLDEISLLLTDLVMPDELTGKDLAAKMREEKPSLKVIYTSGYSAEAVHSDSQFLEGLNFLPKPYSPQKLSEILRRNLD
jgi:two-component system cell cycle sensor histidine kinase/response regulator CckA